MAPVNLERQRDKLLSLNKFGNFTVFHFESTKSSELGQPYTEAALLRAACSLIGHSFCDFRPLGTDDLRRQLSFIFSTWEVRVSVPKIHPETEVQFAIHFSCHGNKDGVQFGGDFLNWKKLADVLASARDDISVAHLIAISACGAATAPIGNELARKQTRGKPIYIFSFDGDVGWTDASLAWAILYHKLQEAKVGNYIRMQRIISAIRAVGMPLMYRRWDGKKYRRYPIQRA